MKTECLDTELNEFCASELQIRAVFSIITISGSDKTFLDHHKNLSAFSDYLPISSELSLFYENATQRFLQLDQTKLLSPILAFSLKFSHEHKVASEVSNLQSNPRSF